MKLEEVKEIVQKLVAWFNLGNKSIILGCEEFEALVMVAQELEHLQKENELAKKALIANSYEADERNNLLVKIQELKKENEKYRSGELLTANQVKSFEETTKKYYIHKDKIREKIEELEKTGCTSYDASTADAYQSQDIGAWNALTDLLKEE